jgi:hypothetical protein
MMIAIHTEIEEFDSLDGLNGMGNGTNSLAVFAFTEVGNAFQVFIRRQT